MKVTFTEEIEQHSAWWPSMYCSKCTHYRYTIHHQTEPETDEAWWIECLKCGHTTPALPTRELAMSAWRSEERVC